MREVRVINELGQADTVSIPAERAARLREALSTDPRLAELAALMRADPGRACADRLC